MRTHPAPAGCACVLLLLHVGDAGVGWQAAVAAHARDLFVFDNTELSKRFTGGGARPAALPARVSAAWIAFATDGKQADGLPEWSAYDAERRATLVINDECEMVDDPNRARREAMQQAMGLA
jgi:para-nitrobenzyl esterase